MNGQTRACGTFSFTLAMEWDYVSRNQRADYIQNSYTVSITERLNMWKATALLMESGDWEPYAAVTDISKEKLLPVIGKDVRHRSPLFNEYLYFNSHMRRLVYNQSGYERDDKTTFAKAARDNAAVILQWTPSGKELQTGQGGEKVQTGQGGEKVQTGQGEKKAQKVQAGYYLQRYYPEKTEKGQVTEPARIREYKLPISSIDLRLYAVGVMLLTIRCQNEELTQQGYYRYRECEAKNGFTDSDEWHDVLMVDDIAWIENCGRRLFAARTANFPCGDDGYFNDFPLLSYIKVTGTGKEDNRKIVLCDLRRMVWTNAEDGKAYACTKPEHLSFVCELISARCMTKVAMREAWKSGNTEAGAKKDYLILDSYNDERMYLHGSIESPEISAITREGWMQRKETKSAVELKPWYGILYADPGWDATCQDPAMIVSAVEEGTEARWVNYGTFHGMTYHSMVMLLECVTKASYLITNNDWMYLQMFLIAVLQRCAIQRFYREASGLLQTHTLYDDRLRAAVQDKYTLFLNQFWFYEVMEQEQGKAMFSKLQKTMNVNADVEFLDRALDELNQQAENRTNSKVNKLLVPISILGGIWAFTEMGLRLRDTLVAHGYSWMSPLPLGRQFAGLLGLAILIGFGVYGWHQVRYLREFIPKLWKCCARWCRKKFRITKKKVK